MKMIWLRFKCWLENKISQRLFGQDTISALLYMNIGKIYSASIINETAVCPECGAKWFPQVCGTLKNSNKPRYCPFCGKHR